jgi:hypothetical protein
MLLRPCFGFTPHSDRTQHDVFQNTHMGEQVERLKDHADVRPHGGQGLALCRKISVVEDNPAGVYAFQPVHGPAQR